MQIAKLHVERLAEVFVQLYRVLSDSGTFWLNISDSYCGTGSKGACLDPKNPKGRNGQKVSLTQNVRGCKNKDMIGIPWMLAFALRDLGWYLRSDIIWQKGNAMPENVKDRPTRSYEHVFLFSKSSRYYYDVSAIAEPIAPSTAARYMGGRSGSSKYSATVLKDRADKEAVSGKEKAAVRYLKLCGCRHSKDGAACR